MGRGAWRATVHRVAKSQTRLKRHRTHVQPNALPGNLGKVFTSISDDYLSKLQPTEQFPCVWCSDYG